MNDSKKPKRRPVNYAPTSSYDNLILQERNSIDSSDVQTRSSVSTRSFEMMPARSASLLRHSFDNRQADSTKTILEDIIEDVELKKTNTTMNFLSTPKRLIPGDTSRYTMDPNNLKDLHASSLRRSNTSKDLRRHNRSLTNNDSASIDSGKSKEAANKIKNALVELEQLRKRNEELEVRLKALGDDRSGEEVCTKGGEVWKEIEDFTDKIMTLLKLEKETDPKATKPTADADNTVGAAKPVLKTQPTLPTEDKPVADKDKPIESPQKSSNIEPIPASDYVTKDAPTLPPIPATDTIEAKSSQTLVEETTSPIASQDMDTFKNDILQMLNGFGL